MEHVNNFEGTTFLDEHTADKIYQIDKVDGQCGIIWVYQIPSILVKKKKRKKGKLLKNFYRNKWKCYDLLYKK